MPEPSTRAGGGAAAPAAPTGQTPGARWHLLPAAAAIATVLWRLAPARSPEGLGFVMGHDFYHYFARTIAGAVHFWQNGLAVFHYTPTLCGGLPVFADPQSMYYSVPQVLTFFLSPLTAVQVATALFYVLGGWGFHRLLREGFGCGPRTAHLGAILFLLNGFAFENLLVGHVTHHGYLLLPWLLLYPLRVASEPGGPWLRQAARFSIVVTCAFYGGGVHVIVVFLAALALGMPLFLRRALAARGGVTVLVVFLATGVILVMAACAPKLAAAVRLSSTFVETPVDRAVISIPSLVRQYFWLDRRATPDILGFGAAVYGPWEFVGFVSLLLVPVPPALLVHGLWPFSRRRIPLVVAYIVLVWVLLWVGAGRHSNLDLPLIRHYHNPLKIYGAFIPYLILGFAVLVARLSAHPALGSMSARLKDLLFLLAAGTAIIEFSTNARFFSTHGLVLRFRYSPSVYDSLRKARRLPAVTTVTAQGGTDVEGIGRGMTSLHCYEPMFGYRGEAMMSSVVPGETGAVRDGAFNLTHPGCLVYPERFGCHPWDRIPEADRQNFQRFITGSVARWGVPAWQEALLWMGLTSTIVVLVLACGGSRGSGRLTCPPPPGATLR